MENIEGNKKRNTGETSLYDEVMDSGIHNDGMNNDSFPSSGKKNNNERLSGKSNQQEIPGP